MTLSPTCAVTPDTSKTDDSDFDDNFAEILAEEEARVIKNPIWKWQFGHPDQ